MIIESIAYYLQDMDIMVAGEELFIGQMPVDVSECVAVMYAPSPIPNQALQVYEQTLDFWSRNKNSDAGYGKLFAIMSLLHQAQNYEVEGYHVYFSNALGLIDDNDRDIEGRKLYKLSIRFIYRVSDDGS